MKFRKEGKISIYRMPFYAYHGVLKEERVIGGNYEVTFDIYFNALKAIESDMLKDTIDYARVCKLVTKEMAIPSNLIEHVAGRITDSLFKNFEAITCIEIELTKLKPPVKGNMPQVSFFIRKERDGR